MPSVRKIKKQLLYHSILSQIIATLSQHSLTDDTDEQKEQISFLHTERLRDLKVGELTDL